MTEARVRVMMFSRWGTRLGTRALGKRIREELHREISMSNEVIVLDFEDVKLITHSFADECFRKLAKKVGFDRLKNRTTFRNVEPIVEVILLSVLRDYVKNEEDI